MTLRMRSSYLAWVLLRAIIMRSLYSFSTWGEVVDVALVPGQALLEVSDLRLGRLDLGPDAGELGRQGDVGRVVGLVLGLTGGRARLEALFELSDLGPGLDHVGVLIRELLPEVRELDLQLAQALPRRLPP